MRIPALHGGAAVLVRIWSLAVLAFAAFILAAGRIRWTDPFASKLDVRPATHPYRYWGLLAAMLALASAGLWISRDRSNAEPDP